MKLGDNVWHPKTKLFGTIKAIYIEGEAFEFETEATQDVKDHPVPQGHALVWVQDALIGVPCCYVWSISSIEPLDAEEAGLVAELVKWKKRKTELNKEIAEAGSAYAAAEEAMLAFLDRMAVQGTRQYAGVGQVTIDGVEVHPSITEEDRETAYAEIEAMGRGEIIKRTIHPSTLEAFVNELKDTGVPVPAHIKVFERPKLSFAKKK